MKSLIIYFSRTGENYTIGNISKGNTEIVAEEIQKLTNADLFKCDPLVPYSSDYKKCIEEARIKMEEDARPKLKNYLKDINNYDVIYIGGPIYFGEYPYEIYSALEGLDFNGKIIRPFSTHEGSALGKCIGVLRDKCKGAIIKQGLAIRGSEVSEEASKIKIINWVNKDN